MKKTNASYCLIRKKDLVHLNHKKVTPVISEKPLIDFILIALLFYPDSNYDSDTVKVSKKNKKYIIRNSFIDESVKLGKNFAIGFNSIIKKNVKIGDNVKIGSNCIISNSIISKNVIIGDGSIVGKIGFGFKYINNQNIFIPHFGCVKIEEDVYIGSGCIIDRGSFFNTTINKGVKLDNQVHIAHNVSIGDNTYIAAQTGIAGSTKIGKRCTFAGKVGVADNLVICDDAHFTGQSAVRTDIKEPGVYSSGVLLEESRNWLKNAMRFKQLNTLFKQVKDLSRNDSNK